MEENLRRDNKEVERRFGLSYYFCKFVSGVFNLHKDQRHDQCSFKTLVPKLVCILESAVRLPKLLKLVSRSRSYDLIVLGCGLSFGIFIRSSGDSNMQTSLRTAF